MVAAGFYDATQETDKTRSMYEKALKIKPNDVNIMTTMAGFFLKHRQMEAAEQYLAKVLEERPNFFPARMMKGEIAALNKDFVGAIGIFDQLIKEEPRSSRAHYLKGFSHLGKGETQVAKASLAKAVELNPKYVKARMLLIDMVMRDRDFERAQRESQEILALNPKDYRARMMLGNALMAQGRVAEAEAAFNALIDESPENPAGFYRLGLLQRSAKKYDDALESFNTALKLNPMLMDVFTNIVMFYGAKGQVETALDRCDEQLNTVGDSSVHRAIINNLKGGLFLAQKDTDAAKTAFAAAIQEISASCSAAAFVFRRPSGKMSMRSYPAEN
jgi:tetratricopeptide (TPR) repeat protein